MSGHSLKTSTGKSHKNEYIQLLRGIAIIAVVMIHSTAPDFLRVFLRPFLNFAVALFVFLSGYLTKLKITDVGLFFRKRIFKVIVPYLIWSVIYSIPNGFDGFFLNLLTGRCCGIFYYIFVYIQFVLLTPLIIRLLQSKYHWIGWVITPIGTIAFRYIFKFQNLSILTGNFQYLFIAWFIYYYMGLYLGNGIGPRPPKIKTCIILYALAVVVSVLEGLYWYRLNDIDMATTQLRLTSILTSVIFLLICHHIIQKTYGTAPKTRWIKMLIILGDYSFGIYWSHMMIRPILGRLVLKWMFFPINALMILCISAICVAVGKRLLGKYSWFLGL